jgi:hypothetical protein
MNYSIISEKQRTLKITSEGIQPSNPDQIRNSQKVENVLSLGQENCLDLTGGGIIPYDNKGMWLLSEKRKDKKMLSDAGGKYRFEDVDIFGCMAREWNEETYFTSEIRRRDVLTLLEKHRTKLSYSRCNTGKIVYVTYFFHVEDLKELNIILPTKEQFIESRNFAISKNKNSTAYSSLSLDYYELKELKENRLACNPRLNRVFKNLHKVTNVNFKSI